MIRSKAIRQSAEYESCTVYGPNCNGDVTTVVWAHSNQLIHGKGKGIKAHDIFGCYACMPCHKWLDENSTMTDRAFNYAMARSWLRLIEKGIMIVKDVTPYDAVSKMLPRC